MSEKREWKGIATWELLQGVAAIQKSLTRPEEKELVEEVFRRLGDFNQLNPGQIPGGEADTRHDGKIERLQNAITFFDKVSRILNNRGLLDWSQPFEKVSDNLGVAVDAMGKRATKLLAIICEIYARGGVKFNHLALPDDVEKEVSKTLKKTGQID